MDQISDIQTTTKGSAHLEIRELKSTNPTAKDPTDISPITHHPSRANHETSDCCAGWIGGDLGHGQRSLDSRPPWSGPVVHHGDDPVRAINFVMTSTTRARKCFTWRVFARLVPWWRNDGRGDAVGEG